jgi:hypothetical protein
LFRPSGKPISADERVVVVAMDSLVLGAVFASVALPDGARAPQMDAPVMREVVEEWLRQRGGRLSASEFVDSSYGRWQYAGIATTDCVVE